MRKTLILLALLASPLRAFGQVSETPGNSVAALLAVDQDWFYNDGQYFTTAAQNQQYATSGHTYIQSSPTWAPAFDLGTLISEWGKAEFSLGNPGLIDSGSETT